MDDTCLMCGKHLPKDHDGLCGTCKQKIKEKAAIEKACKEAAREVWKAWAKEMAESEADMEVKC